MNLSNYVGLPFRDGGRDRPAVDCWGLIVLAYRECLGIDLPLYGDVLASDLRRVSRSVDAGKDGWRRVETPREMDVAVMRLPSSKRVGHVGIYAGRGQILHAEQASGVALERVSSPVIASRIVGFWRYA
nr:NlpC/P60 family protein [uncultured Roseovarius sp.]